jgi:hypothetical protein
MFHNRRRGEVTLEIILKDWGVTGQNYSWEQYNENFRSIHNGDIRMTYAVYGL